MKGRRERRGRKERSKEGRDMKGRRERRGRKERSREGEGREIKKRGMRKRKRRRGRRGRKRGRGPRLLTTMASSYHYCGVHTFIKWSTRARSCVLADNRQYILSPGFATSRSANSLWNINTAHLP